MAFIRERLMRWLRRWVPRSLSEVLAFSEPEPENLASRIWFVERNIALPAKAVLFVFLFKFLFFSHWIEEVVDARMVPLGTARMVVLETVQRYFLIYVVLNLGAGFLLLGMRQFPIAAVHWTVVTISLLDGLLVSGLTILTGGFDSVLYWVFLAMVVRNAISNPIAVAQIALNLSVCVFYVVAGWMEWGVVELMGEPAQGTAEQLVLRLALLLTMSAWCFGVQVLFDRHRRAQEEAREHALRQEQLQSAGRLAAEIAHQLKNPLGIINNAAFTLQRSVKEGRGTITQQIQIIREEIDRSDRIITELMGYAKLVEGRVEKLNVNEELDRAIEQVFPRGASFDTTVERDYAPVVPTLLAQRNHVAEVFVNLLQNARETTAGRGRIRVTTRCGDNYSILVTMEDDGPGVAPELVNRIFEPYFTTREKGTGLGLAIVKHNVEMYGGTVRVESGLGKGARFVVQFPARASMTLAK